MKKIVLVAGARPNFMKIAPTLRELERRRIGRTILVHTGQHYDNNMSEAFFRGLAIRTPDYFLNVGSGSHAVQTAAVMVEFETVCFKERPDIVVVVGDVNSTIAAGLVAKKLGITLAHIEAGLRSGDRTMPEEINRIATDAISDMLFTTEDRACANLRQEGHSGESIHFVGHVMIDNLMHQLAQVEQGAVSARAAAIRMRLPERYVCLTMHRPANVDDKGKLVSLVRAVATISREAPVIFPCHPRTRQRLQEFGLVDAFDAVPGGQAERLRPGVYLEEPMSYNDFLLLWKDASVVITDSGGLQEETTALRVPCITIRDNTERPVTVEIGSNVVAGTDPERVVTAARRALAGEWKQCGTPPLWDGRAAKRIVDVLSRA